MPIPVRADCESEATPPAYADRRSVSSLYRRVVLPLAPEFVRNWPLPPQFRNLFRQAFAAPVSIAATTPQPADRWEGLPATGRSRGRKNPAYTVLRSLPASRYSDARS